MLDGGAGHDEVYGQNGNDLLRGGAGDDLIDGNNGFDIAYYSGPIQEYTFLASAGYLHIRHLGGAGADGHDRVTRVERLVFADRIIELGSGRNVPVAIADFVILDEDAGAYASGAVGVLANDFDFDGDPMTVTAGVFAGAYGTLTLNSDGSYHYILSAGAQALGLGDNVQDSFSYTVSDNDGSDTGVLTFSITGLNDAPVAAPDSVATGENEAVLIDVLANDEDVDDGAVLTVTAASAPAGRGTASLVDNKVQYDPAGDFDALAVGETEDVLVSYDIVDEHGATSSSTVTVTVTGANDGPVANPDMFATDENGAVLIDVAANDTDVDNDAVLTVASASAPGGQGNASGNGAQLRFDPGSDFDDLAAGDSEIVVVDYTISDEHGATASSTVTITVTGANDGPVANADSRTTSENNAVVVDVLGNDVDVDREAVLTVIAASAPAGQGVVTVVENEVRFDPGGDFDHLASGESAVVVISYTIEDEHGASDSSTVTITVQGRDQGVVNTGTEDGETLVGTTGDDTIDALGGDDSVYGLAGEDLLFGGAGSDFLSGDEGDDVGDGGSGDDFLLGGDGNDQLLGQAGNDSVVGEDGDDRLSGGDGLDFLTGGAGDDSIEGGADDDFLFGGDGHDQLSGQAGGDLLFGESGDDGLSGGTGDDSLDGGEGDDTLHGGDGDDFLSGGLGTNVLNGGLGHDRIVADSSDGPQAIDGGSGNDSIRHSYRSSASVIATGAGSDTIEIAYADVGSAAVVVSDFTTGAGGDRLQLSGEDGSLLSLLSGWDGSSNPFASGFLRLQQSGTDTLLQWDRDGVGEDSDWETLTVFENTDAGDFTDANFVPGYHPDGSDPAGQTITGTEESESLTGTFGDDTIHALGGDDIVSGLVGADLIDGGDGLDSLYGDSGDDVVEGGNDDDFLSGGDGDDQLFGEAGNDILSGEAGDDGLSGGEGNDSLDGSDGDDSLEGGGGNDFLSGGLGTNVLNAGLGQDRILADSTDGVQTVDAGDGDDTIRHFYRSSASLIATGGGSDSIELVHADIGTEAIVVTDFTPGTGGDRLRLSGDDGLLSLLSGWDGSSNPFGSGFLRLEQSGDDTLLQWDRDGAGEESGWESLFVFRNTETGDFTDANFEPGYNPAGSAPAGATITGTNNNDSLTGTFGDDTINALAGDDLASGGSGADLIRGGDGSDFLYGNSGNDVVEGGNGSDLLAGGDGGDQLSGEAGNDILAGEAGGDQLAGGDGNDSLDGSDGDDSLDGGAGQDFLAGGAGADVMTGGADADVFDFQSASHGPDQIADFAGESDRIRIWSSGFEGGLAAGGTVSLISGSDPTASEESGQFLYDTDDGSLFWDSDGTGSGEAVLVATFANLPSLQASDFFVI
jgi:VCBS repeat-containing protein